MNRFRKGVVFTLLLAALLFTAALVHAAALTPDQIYTVTLSYLNSDGTLEADVATTTAVADANGKLDFSFTGAPDTATCNWLLLSVKNAEGTTVRRALAPSAPEGETTELGVCDLTEAQTGSLLVMAEGAGTDDPIMMAFALIIVRSAGISADDAANLAVVAATAITGDNGFVGHLSDKGVTDAQLATLRQALIHNDTADLGDFTALFKDSVEAADADTAVELQGLAGGKIAEIFCAAAVEAGINVGVLLDALEVTGDAAGSCPEFGELGVATLASIDGAMSAFHQGMAAYKVKAEYEHALSVLGASDSQIERWNAAIDDLVSAMRQIDRTYSKYYSDPAHNVMTEEVRAQRDAAYQTIFEAFRTAMQSNEDELSALRTDVAEAMGINEDDLPPDFGHEFDSGGDPVAWPIPKVVAMSWFAAILTAGGELNYDRVDIPVPDICTGWGFAKEDFEFTGAGAPFFQLEQDVFLAQATRWASYQDLGGQPTRAQELAIKQDYYDTLRDIAAALSGTTDGTTAISSAQAAALTQTFIPPNI
ncbi:MAG: hypothetical protein V2A77_05850 [Pseudomonadota bacterium]